MTTFCDLLVKLITKEDEESKAEEQAAKERYWKIPICDDDDDDYTIAITPVLSIEEPVNSLSMGDEHLDTIPATESDDRPIMSSVSQDIVPLPNCCQFRDDNIFRVDEESPFGEDIDYVDAPSDVEIDSFRGGGDCDRSGRIDDDIF
ncbi:hypothetical protein Tco_0703405 [Tanacetum coccineum]|uniref:Uncharacterized protein n=1 Tax=Tanacetum coccineum TaxID=301880 RepID=A0ABQ4XZB9_9ASTR